MGKICISCNYERKTSDISPYYECPKCGTIYAKAEKAKEEKRKREEAEAAAKAAKKQEEIAKKNKRKEKILSIPRKIMKLGSSSKENMRNRKTVLVSILILITLISVTIAYVLYSENNRKDYISRLTIASSKINEATKSCLHICRVYASVWKSAIDDRRDFNIALALQKMNFDETGFLKGLEDTKNEIEFLLKELLKNSKILPECHSKTVQLYGIYSQIYSLAISPSGTLLSFNNKIGDLENEFTKINNEIKVLLPK